MSLIAILISLVLERSFRSLRDYRQFDWFDKYTDKIKKLSDDRAWQGPVVVLLVVSGPIIGVIFLNALFDGVMLGLLSLVFTTAVLFLCLGPQDLEKQVDNFIVAWESEDEADAKAAAKEILGETPPEALSELQKQLLERILIVGSEQILTPLIWFTVFALLGSGPLGVVFYRMSCHLHDRFGMQSDAFANAINRLHAILGWVPAHLVALLFAMAGSFVDVIQRWNEARQEWQEDWQKTASLAVITAGLSALQMPVAITEDDVSSDDIPQHIRAVIGLVLRSIVILVVVIAVVTLTVFGA